MINSIRTEETLQGRVQVPTGGKAREPQGMNRCDSGADSKVWMEEVDHIKSMEDL